MKVIYGNRVILCDRVTEKDGILTMYQGGGPIMQMSNIPDMSLIQVEGGEIEEEITVNDLIEALKGVGIFDENGTVNPDSAV